MSLYNSSELLLIEIMAIDIRQSVIIEYITLFHCYWIKLIKL